MLNALLISNIVLWMVVIALALLCFALARQIGVLYERVAPAGALAVNNKLQAGAPAPQLAVVDINSGRRLMVGQGDNPSRDQLLFFLSPDCSVCKTLLPALLSVTKAERQWLEVILASDGELQRHRDFIQRHNLQDMAYVSSELLGRQYGVAKLPYAVLISGSGKILSMGLINSREHLESLFEAKERGVATIQDFMAAPTVASDVKS